MKKNGKGVGEEAKGRGEKVLRGEVRIQPLIEVNHNTFEDNPVVIQA